VSVWHGSGAVQGHDVWRCRRVRRVRQSDAWRRRLAAVRSRRSFTRLDVRRRATTPISHADPWSSRGRRADPPQLQRYVRAHRLTTVRRRRRQLASDVRRRVRPGRAPDRRRFDATQSRLCYRHRVPADRRPTGSPLWRGRTTSRLRTTQLTGARHSDSHAIPEGRQLRPSWAGLVEVFGRHSQRAASLVYVYWVLLPCLRATGELRSANRFDHFFSFENEIQFLVKVG